MPLPIRIILVDDHDLIRDSLKILLDKDNRFDVIAQCKTGTEAIKQAKELFPDVMLMDINMAPLNGFDTTKLILEINSSIKIIGLSVNNSPQYAARMFEIGGRGFVTKTSAFTELKTAIQKVFEGERYVCNEIQKKSQEKNKY
jgi:two-component system, NarL family, invasion response regulator UvrY